VGVGVLMAQITMTLKQLIEDAREHFNAGMKVEDYTCYNCGAWQGCLYAFDVYNTDGDCLAEK